MAKEVEVFNRWNQIAIDDDMEMSTVGDYNSAIKLLESEGITRTMIGDGFYPLDKDSLVGEPFVILGGHAWWSDEYDAPVCALKIATKNPVRQADGSDDKVTKGLLIDGSSGIYQQAESYARVGRLVGLECPKGLTRSEYDTEIEGKKVHGVTFYLS